MDFDLGEPAAQLRTRLRELLGELLPADWAGPLGRPGRARGGPAEVCERLAAERLLTIELARGVRRRRGQRMEQAVLREEMWAHFEPAARSTWA